MFAQRNFLRWLSYVLAGLALAACVFLVAGDAKLWSPSGQAFAAISAAPLLLVGASSLVVQAIIRPRLSELVKNLLLAATFLLWGAIQLLPRTAVSERLGNLVIVLYVVDLAWVTFAVVDRGRRKKEG